MSLNTVELAFAQFEADGYLVRRRGSGTYVSRTLPGRPVGASAGVGLSKTARLPMSEGKREKEYVQRDRRSRRAATRWSMPSEGSNAGADPQLDFGACGPALDHFPVALWNRQAAKRARLADLALLRGGEEGGYRPLREAIAASLGAVRGVRCRWEQVIVMTSTRQSFDLAVRLLLEPGDRAWMEDPGLPVRPRHARRQPRARRAHPRR